MGVGCLLLILNMLIFAGIYYQRDRSRRKNRLARRSSSEKNVEGRNLSPGDCSGQSLVHTIATTYESCSVPRHNSQKYNRIYRGNPLQSIWGHKFKQDYRPRGEQESQNKMKIHRHSQHNCCCPLTATFQCDHSKSGCTLKVGQFRFNNFLIHKVFGSGTRCVAPQRKA